MQSSSCRVSQGADSSHMEFARKSQLWFGLCWRVCPSRENLLQQEWRLCLQNWLWNNSEDEWMTWSQERPPRYIEEGFSSHRHLLIRNRCTESFINSWNSTLLYILIVCQCLTIRWKMPISDYNRMEDEVRKNMIPLLKFLDSKTETMDSSYDVM